MTRTITKRKGGHFNMGAALPPIKVAWRVNASKLAILITLLQILVKGKVHYCQPHPERLLELLQQYHKITIERRWFFQCLKDLEEAGFIYRRRRWLKLPDTTIRSHSSLWFFTLRGIQFLKAKAIHGAQELAARMLAWLHRDDAREPGDKCLTSPNDPTDPATAIKRLRDIAGALFKPIP